MGSTQQLRHDHIGNVNGDDTRLGSAQHFSQYNGTSLSSIMGVHGLLNGMNGIQPQRHLTGCMESGAVAYRALGIHHEGGGLASGHFGTGQEHHVGWNSGPASG